GVNLIFLLDSQDAGTCRSSSRRTQRSALQTSRQATNLEDMLAGLRNLHLALADYQSPVAKNGHGLDGCLYRNIHSPPRALLMFSWIYVIVCRKRHVFIRVAAIFGCP